MVGFSSRELVEIYWYPILQEEDIIHNSISKKSYCPTNNSILNVCIVSADEHYKLKDVLK